MGKTISTIKIWNILDNEKIKNGEIKPLEIEAQIDSGATDIVLTEKIVNGLNLIRMGKTTIKYANGSIEEREIAHGVVTEILGRIHTWSAIIEPRLDRPLIGNWTNSIGSTRFMDRFKKW